MDENKVREAEVIEMEIREIDVSDIPVKKKKHIKSGLVISGGITLTLLVLRGLWKSFWKRSNYEKSLNPQELELYSYKKKSNRYRRRLGLIKLLASKKTKKTMGYRKVKKLLEVYKPSKR